MGFKRLDRWANARLLNGYKEFISSRCGKAMRRCVEGREERGDWKWVLLGSLVDLAALPFQRMHCLRAIEDDRGRA